MRFYAIAYQLDEDVFYDFNKREDTFEISENCFLPTREMAEEYIENELSVDCEVVEIELKTLEENGSYSYVVNS